MLRLDHPDADSFVAAGVDIAGVLKRHFRVGRVQAADMAMVQAVLTSDEDFPQGPFVFHACSSCRAPRLLAHLAEMPIRADALFSGQFCGAFLFGVGEQAFAHPAAFVPGAVAGFQPFGVAGAIALEHVKEFGRVRSEMVIRIFSLLRSSLLVLHQLTIVSW